MVDGATLTRMLSTLLQPNSQAIRQTEEATKRFGGFYVSLVYVLMLEIPVTIGAYNFNKNMGRRRCHRPSVDHTHYITTVQFK